MIVWQNAAALWALPLAAVPFIVHLLRTHHAKRVAFPSLRFVQPSRTAAVRMRLPSDVLLMLVRIATVGLAVGALAGPIVLTEARTAAWNARTARAVVVDVSDSMRVADGSAAPPEGAAAEAAAAELRTATYGRRIDTRDLEDGLARASRWLAASPPARREVVVISDLQRGTLGRSGTIAVTGGIGLRFIPIGRIAKTKTFDGAALFGAGDVAVRGQEIEATADTTAVAFEARPGNQMAGLRLIAPVGAERDVARLLRAVAIAGAPAGSSRAAHCHTVRRRCFNHRSAHGHKARVDAADRPAPVRGFDAGVIVLMVRAPGASRGRPRPLDNRRAEPRWLTACASRGVGERTAPRRRGPTREPLCGGGRPGRAERARGCERLRRTRNRASRREGAVHVEQAARLGDARRLAPSGLDRCAMVLAPRDRPARRGAVAPRAVGAPSTAGGGPCSRLSGPIGPPISSALSPPSSGGCGSQRSCRSIAVALPLGAVLDVLLEKAGMPALGAASIVGALLAGLAALWLSRVRQRSVPAAAARAIEGARPSSRNVVITAEELLRHPERAAGPIRARVLYESAEIAGAIDRTEVVPLSRLAVLATLALVFAAALVTGVSGRAARVAVHAIQQAVERARPAPAGAPTVLATIVPPAYTREPARTVRNPERVEALQGSRLSLTVQGAGPWRVRFGTDALVATVSGDSTVVDLALTRSGYLAIEPQDRDAGASRRLLPVTVIPDRAPTIRVEAPGRDLLLPDTTPVVGLSASATDDFGLQSLELRYTKVSGSGEQFEFNEGALPLTIARESGRAWKARTDLALATLGLAPGDAMIYRIVGRDERPGDAGLASSETFFIEVAGPGQVALAGFELPPDRERYALSQQMIVLKLERLRARERALDRATLEREVGNIAAEQRAVRANFVFLMGGQVEDEEAEAEHSHEIQEGRLENTARREIVDAIQHMGRVEVGLAAINTTAALPPARAAVDALQRAFGRNRYILRALPVRSRVDPSRRLTGETSNASDWRRELFPPAPDVAVQAARGMLARLLDLSSSITSGSAAPLVLTALAEEALAVDPAAEDWQAVSKGLLQLRDGRATVLERSATLNQVVARVASVAERASMATRSLERNRGLKSAWAEERRQ